MNIDLMPIFYLAVGFLGAILGLVVSLLLWIFIPAGAWMLAVVAGMVVAALVAFMIYAMTLDGV
ncbi:MAG TPA: hypothetical protein VGO34_14720 [Alphaproteobacteria bacterium]|jgi:hypothetical protein